MPTIDEVRDHFKRAGVATQKWPEELHQVPQGQDYPRTASGKVQKFAVREAIRNGALARGDIAACTK
jgi:non-ribosomal peptide synthetase component E (peptide arylation enzyme)